MKSVRKIRVFGTRLGDLPDLLTESLPHSPSAFLTTLGWVSAGAGALGLGLIVGRELRHRYKFNRRTPYDLYSHSGDFSNDFGVGI